GPCGFLSYLTQRRDRSGGGLFAVQGAAVGRTQLFDYIAKFFKFSHSERSRRIPSRYLQAAFTSGFREIALMLARWDPSGSARDDILNAPERPVRTELRDFPRGFLANINGDADHTD